MSELGIQLQNKIEREILSGETVLFSDVLVNSDSDIVYDNSTGTIYFISAGQYYVSWFVVTQTALGTQGPSFSIVTNEAEPSYYTAGSSVKNGEIFGSALLEVTAGLSISLISMGNVSLSSAVTVNAGITVLNTGIKGATGDPVIIGLSK